MLPVPTHQKNKKISNCSLSVHGVDHGVGNINTFQEERLQQLVTVVSMMAAALPARATTATAINTTPTRTTFKTGNNPKKSLLAAASLNENRQLENQSEETSFANAAIPLNEEASSKCPQQHPSVRFEYRQQSEDFIFKGSNTAQ
jgi:hypothetical protein